MKAITKLKLGGAFILVMSMLAGAWPLVFMALPVIGWLVMRKLGSAPDGTREGVGKVIELLVAAPMNFAALVAQKRWGLYAIVSVVAMMLVDASFGNDGIGFPVIGWLLIFLIALVVGGYDWYWKKAPLFEQVEEAVRAAVPGYTRTREPDIYYGDGPLNRFFGKFQPLTKIAFRLPGEVDSTHLEDIEIRLRLRPSTPPCLRRSSGPTPSLASPPVPRP